MWYWAIGISIFLVLWTVYSIWEFSRSCPHMHLLTWWGKVVFAPVNVIVWFMMIGMTAKFRFNSLLYKDGNSQPLFKHQRGKPLTVEERRSLDAKVFDDE